jgi:steroid delta-isomerase-like uncharacterized protein
MPNSKELVQTIFSDVFNGGRFELLEKILHSEYVNNSFPAPVKGPAGFRGTIEMFYKAFPDMKIVLEDILSEGNKVATRGYWTGTHKGDFMNIPPTNRAVNVNFIDMWIVKDGKIYENWVQMDIAGLMQQLGSA